MIKRVKSLAAACLTLTAFVFLTAPVWAQGVDQKIRALEDELGKLKSEQMELRKEATAAAAALPTFTYRAGSGILMEGADKSWSIRTHMRWHTQVLFLDGKDQAGRTNGEVFMRRVRPTFYLCLNDCFYEIEFAMDFDGFDTRSDLQRATGYVHFENINPWLPTFYIGADAPSDINAYTQMSSNVSAQLEYDLLRRNSGYNTGSMGNGMGLRWEDLRIGPGRYRITLAMGNVGAGSDGLSRFSDRKDFVTYLQARPFTQIKSKWIQGFGFSIGAWFCNNDDKGNFGTLNSRYVPAENGCNRLRLRDHFGQTTSQKSTGRQVLFDTGGDEVGRGLVTFVTPGLGWQIGPYTLRGTLGFLRFADQDNGRAAGLKGFGFLIAHQLYVWSPKGFLTGSPSTPGSVLLGYHFERNDVECGKHDQCASVGGHMGEFHRNRVIVNEWDIWYVIQRGMNVGIAWLWYDASNLDGRPGRARQNLLEKASSNPATHGKGGNWLDVVLAWRWQW